MQLPAGMLSAVSRSWRRRLVVALAVATGYAVAVGQFESSGWAIMRVDMVVSGGQRAEVYVNNRASAPIVVVLEMGVRRTYEFPFPRQDLRTVRIDPTDVVGAEVQIFGIDILDRSQTVARFKPADVRRWALSGLEVREDASSFSFKALTQDPIVQTTATIRMVPAPRLQELRDVGHALQQLQGWLINHPYTVPLLLLPVLVLAGRRAVVPMIVIALILVTMSWIIHASHDWKPRPPPLGVAVSRASFLGVPLRVNQLVSLAALASAIVLGSIAALAARVRQASDAESQLPAGESRRVSVLIAWWIALALIVAPDLSGYLAGAGSYVYSPEWDGNNFIYWAYLATRGDLPFRDYWYPYSGQYLFDLAWPTGPLARWAFEVLLFGIFATSMWLLAGQRRVWAVAAAGALLVVDRTGLIWGAQRYLLGINVLLAYLAVSRAPSLRAGQVLLAAGAVGMAITFEPAQLAYAVPTLVVIWVFDAAFNRPRTSAALRAALRVPALFAVLGVITILATASILAVTGQLKGAWAFHRTLADAVQYSAIPTMLPAGDWTLLDVSAAVLWWPAVAVAIGLFDRLSSSNRSASLRGDVMLGLGLLAFAVLQKHFLRPMEHQLALYPVVGGLAFALFTPGQMLVRTTIVLGVGVGIFAGTLTEHGQLQVLRDLATQSPLRLVRSVSVLGHSSDFAQANRERFAPARFAQFVEERALVAALEPRVRGRRLTLFALSDQPVLYILTGQPAVWASNMYNASPMSEQRQIIDWLDRVRPDFVVFDPTQLEFDQVPTVARLPLVVSAVVERYVPDSRSGRFEVLRPRAHGEAVSIEYWRSHFGATLNLGHLPGIIDIDGRGPCLDLGACEEYEIVRMLQQPTAGEAVILGYEVAGVRIDVRFDLDAGQARYVLPSSRLWYWKAAATAGVRPTLVRIPPSVRRVTPVKIAADGRRLY